MEQVTQESCSSSPNPKRQLVFYPDRKKMEIMINNVVISFFLQLISRHLTSSCYSIDMISVQKNIRFQIKKRIRMNSSLSAHLSGRKGELRYFMVIAFYYFAYLDDAVP